MEESAVYWLYKTSKVSNIKEEKFIFTHVLRDLPMLALLAAFISETRQNILMGAFSRESYLSQHSQAANRQRERAGVPWSLPKDILADIIFSQLASRLKMSPLSRAFLAADQDCNTQTILGGLFKPWTQVYNKSNLYGARARERYFECQIIDIFVIFFHEFLTQWTQNKLVCVLCRFELNVRSFVSTSYSYL